MNLKRGARREEWVEVQFLRHYANGCAGLAGIYILIKAPDLHLALGFRDKTRQNVDQRGLTCAVRPQKPKDRSAWNDQVYPLQRGFFGLSFAACVGLDQTLYADRFLCHRASCPSDLLGS